MAIEFKIGDRVIYRDIGERLLIGTISDVTKDENGEPTGYVVRLDDERILGCIPDEIAHLDLDRLQVKFA